MDSFNIESKLIDLSAVSLNLKNDKMSLLYSLIQNYQKQIDCYKSNIRDCENKVEYYKKCIEKLNDDIEIVHSIIEESNKEKQTTQPVPTIIPNYPYPPYTVGDFPNIQPNTPGVEPLQIICENEQSKIH